MIEVGFFNNVLWFDLSDFGEDWLTSTIRTQNEFVGFSSFPLNLSINNVITRFKNLTLILTSPNFSIFSLLTFNISKSTIVFLLSDDYGGSRVLEILLLFLGVFSLWLLVNSEEISTFLGDLNLEELGLLGIALSSDGDMLETIMDVANLSISEVFTEIIILHEEDTIIWSSIE